jgi:hypothetical protein
MNRTLIGAAVILGIFFIILGAVYWMVPAGSLPGFLPGFEAGSLHVHFKHGLGSAIVGLALLAFAWFQSGPKQT